MKLPSSKVGFVTTSSLGSIPGTTEKKVKKEKSAERMRNGEVLAEGNKVSSMQDK